MTAGAPPSDQILAQAPWVRRLARALARDAQTADDLLQEACVQAIVSPPRHGQNLRGWIAQVLHNLRRQMARKDARRLERERRHQAAQPELAPAAAVVAERAQVHRVVLDAVLALDEPYRSAIWLRFYEEMPPRVIATRLNVPLATVHTRLGRAQAQLRARLDRLFGRRSAWLACCLPLPDLGAAAFPLLLLTMKAKVLAATAALAVLTIAIVGPDRSDSPPPAAVAQEPSLEQPTSTGSTGSPGASAAPSQAQRRTEVPVAAAATAAPAEPTARTVSGRVVDTDGRPVAGLAVALMAAGSSPATVAEAMSSSDGRFTVSAPRRECRAVARARGWTTVMHALIPTDVTPPHALVVVAPLLALQGTVRDELGQPIAGADVQVLWPPDLRARLSDNNDASVAETMLARTAGDGAFALHTASVRAATLVTTADGFVPDRRELPATAEPGLLIVLRTPVVKSGTVQGQVTDDRGQPVADAHVALGAVRTRTAADGKFLLDDDGRAAELAAAKAGARRGVLRRPATGFPAFVRLALGPKALQIHGRVVDAAGAGVAGVKVWSLDATQFGEGRGVMVCEGVAAGCITIDELMNQLRAGKVADPERTYRDTPTAGWPWARTDAAGNFVLAGLEDRPYSLRAMVDRTLLMVDHGSVPAGTRDCVIRLPADGYLPKVAGQVVNRAGAPLRGVRVFAQCDAVRVGTSTSHARSEAVTTTDADGRFSCTDLPRTKVYLRFEGEHTLPLEYGRGAAGGLLDVTRGDVENLRIELTTRMHVQIELADPASADSLRVLDTQGQVLTLNVFEGRSRNSTNSLPLADGRSAVFVVPDSAATLVLAKGDHEVRRASLALVAGDVNKLRF